MSSELRFLDFFPSWFSNAVIPIAKHLSTIPHQWFDIRNTKEIEWIIYSIAGMLSGKDVIAYDLDNLFEKQVIVYRFEDIDKLNDNIGFTLSKGTIHFQQDFVDTQIDELSIFKKLFEFSRNKELVNKKRSKAEEFYHELYKVYL
jgi:hypothetical protein